MNRLIQVTENGTIVAAYGYDPTGLREVKRVYSGGNQTDTIHYIFEGTEPILEQKISDGSVHSYVYALGKYLARVDGEIGDSNANVYYFLTDCQGSIKAVTDQTGAIVFNADYTPFGTQVGQGGNGSFDEEHGFTGKEYDPDIGLYYFNARWYDPEIGRFISEDPECSTPNLYSYCANSPLLLTDPTGKDPFLIIMLISALINGCESASHGGSFLGGFAMGFVTGAFSYGIGEGLDLAEAPILEQVGVQALTGGMVGGIETGAAGGNFWAGFGQGALGGAISAGLDDKMPVNYTMDTVSQLLLVGFKTEIRALLTTGKSADLIDLAEGIADQCLIDGENKAKEKTTTVEGSVSQYLSAPPTSGSGTGGSTDAYCFDSSGNETPCFDSSKFLLGPWSSDISFPTHWEYQQSTGTLCLVDTTGKVTYYDTGYSGRGKGLNNPDDQTTPFVGPIPQGDYTIGAPFDQRGGLGLYVMALTPENGTDTFGRDSFYMHADNSKHNFTASEGCIIIDNMDIRTQVWNSGIHELEVIE